MTTLSTTAHARKPSKKPARTVRVLALPENGHSGVIRLTIGKEKFGYYVDLLPGDVGLPAFRVTHFVTEQKPGEPASYEIQLHADPKHDSCGCPGHHYTGGCKHTSCLRALLPQFRSEASAARHEPETVLPSCCICGEPVDPEESGGSPWHQACSAHEMSEMLRSGW